MGRISYHKILFLPIFWQISTRFFAQAFCEKFLGSLGIIRYNGIEWVQSRKVFCTERKE